MAVIDTGIDGDLPDFRDASGKSRVIATAVTNPNANTVMDTYGHGTHVAGIIAGNSDYRSHSDPLRGKFAGVAPDANLISVKVSDDSGNATVLDVIYGLQFAVDHQKTYNIRVVNMSLDSTTPQSYKLDPLDAAVESAWFHGLVVVVAAGNRGTAPDAVQYAPANDPYVVTVGAVDGNGTITPRDDVIASWSSRGTTQDGFDKPDVNAPGAHIVSVLAPNSTFASSVPVVHHRRPVHHCRRYVDGGPDGVRAGRRHASAARQLEPRPGEGGAEQPADQGQPRDRRGQRTEGGPDAVRTGGRPGPDAEHAAEGQERCDRLQPLHLEPLDLEPGPGRAGRELCPVELELHLRADFFGGR